MKIVIIESPWKKISYWPVVDKLQVLEVFYNGELEKIL